LSGSGSDPGDLAPDIDPDTDAQYQSARREALRLLGHRERATREFSERLGTRFSAPVVARLVTEMTALGYLDDGRMAAQLAWEFTTRRHHAPARLRRELARRGLPESTWDKALAPYSDPERVAATALEATRACLKGRIPDPDDTGAARRLAAYLERRGFASGIIRDIVWQIRQGRLGEPT